MYLTLGRFEKCIYGVIACEKLIIAKMLIYFLDKLNISIEENK